MESEKLLYVILGIVLLYFLFVSDSFGQIGIFFQQIAYTTFYGAEFLVVIALIAIAALIFYQSKSSKKEQSHGSDRSGATHEHVDAGHGHDEEHHKLH